MAFCPSRRGFAQLFAALVSSLGPRALAGPPETPHRRGMTNLIIDDVTPRISYVVGGTPQAAFAIPFAWFEDSNLVVTVGGVTKALTTDYTASGAGVSGGGTLNLVSGVTSTTVIISRVLPIERVTDFPESGPLNISALNLELDRQTAMIQQVSGDIGATIGSDVTVSAPMIPFIEAASLDNAAAILTNTGNIIRFKLQEDTTYYVATTGSDSTGTGAVSAPWATLQHAYAFINKNIDCGNFFATVQVADGTYTAGLTIFAPPPAGPVTSLSGIRFLGNVATPSNVVISTINQCILCTGAGSTVVITGGFKFTSSASDCLYASGGGFISVGGAVDFGSAAGSHMHANVTGNIVVVANYTISGSAQAHYFAGKCAVIEDASTTVTISGTPAFTWFAAAAGAYIIHAGATFINDSGKARQDCTASTHTNTTLDSISIDTSLLSIGMAVVGTGVQAGTVISNITSSTSVALSLATTATAAGVTIAFEIATGQRYLPLLNGVIDNGNVFNAKYFPGSTAGNTNTGGQYAA